MSEKPKLKRNALNAQRTDRLRRWLGRSFGALQYSAIGCFLALVLVLIASNDALSLLRSFAFGVLILACAFGVGAVVATGLTAVLLALEVVIQQVERIGTKGKRKR